MLRPSSYALFAFIIAFTSASAQSAKLTYEEVTFTSHSTKLSGTLVYSNDHPITHALAFVHGSGPQQRNIYWAEKLANKGIATLVYDKRGVAESGGQYESQQSVSGPNIELLADDASAAVTFLSQHKITNPLATGLAGISQAGWIVPLAAEKNPNVDFILLWSGPVCKVSEEDIYSKYTKDLDQTSPPPYQQALAARTSKYIWPAFLGTDSDPATSLVKRNIPGLWIFGKQDGSIPVDLSIKNLSELANQGFNYQYVLYSELGHNNMQGSFATAISWLTKMQEKNH